MSETTYTYSVVNDLSGDYPNISTLEEEIQSSQIITAISSIGLLGE